MDGYMRKRIGLFGGSFDPIHFGHINLALTLSEVYALDEVIFCPAAISPFKGANPPKASNEDRKQMVRLAIEPVKSFSLLSTELDREGTSYTIDTIKDVLTQAHAKRQEVDLFLVLGEDALNHFHQWKDVEEILHLAPPLTGTRVVKFPPSLEMFSPLVAGIIRQGMTKIPVMEISSTVIRERLLKRKFCGHWVPATVLEYIYNHKLYLG